MSEELKTTELSEVTPHKYGRVLQFPASGVSFTVKDIAASNNVSPSFVHGYLKSKMKGRYSLVKQVKGGRGKPASVFTLND